MKIVHGPSDIGGLAVGLATAERRIGLESDVILYSKNKMGSLSFNSKPYIKYFYFGEYKLGFKMLFQPYYEIKKLITIVPLLKQYDVINFTFSTSFLMLPYIGTFFNEIKLLKNQGKSLFVTYQGDDIRLKAYNLKHFEINRYRNSQNKRQEKWYIAETWDIIKKRKIKLFKEYCDMVFCHTPDLMNFIPGSTFRPVSKVDISYWTPVPYKKKNKITIGHAPSDFQTKGTDIILRVIEELKKERNDFDFILINNIPYGQIQTHFKQVDLFIDQLFVGWYGAVTVELMALGKPVMAYLRESDMKYIPAQMKKDIPIINVKPNELKERIRVLLDSKTKLKEIGEKSRFFVEKWHDPLKIAFFMNNYYKNQPKNLTEVCTK